MKTLKNLFLITLVFFSVNSVGQIKVTQNGEIGLNTSNPSTSHNVTVKGNVKFENPDGINNLDLKTTSGTVDLSPGNSGTLGHAKKWNMIYTDDMEADAGLIEALTSYDISSDEIDGYNITGANIYYWNLTDLSDERLKEDITQIESASKLELLNPVSYRYKEGIVLGNDKLKFEAPTNLQSGFIAQEVQAVFPHLVLETDSKGTLGVDVIGIIPYLVKAYQEQQKKIVELEKLLGSEINYKSASTDIENAFESDKTDESSLEQNTPNPFSNSTIIKYSLAEGVSKAEILVFNMNGILLKSYPCQLNSNELMIEANSFQSGMYLYSLLCDDKEVSTKRMIITK